MCETHFTALVLVHIADQSIPYECANSKAASNSQPSHALEFAEPIVVHHWPMSMFRELYRLVVWQSMAEPEFSQLLYLIPASTRKSSVL